MKIRMSCFILMSTCLLFIFTAIIAFFIHNLSVEDYGLNLYFSIFLLFVIIVLIVVLISSVLELSIERKLYSLVSLKMEDSIVVLDGKTKIIFVNNTFLEISGYTQEEIQCKKVSQFGNKKNFAELEERIKKGLLICGCWEGVVNLVKKDGTSFDKYAKISTLLTQNAKKVRFYVIVLSPLKDIEKWELEKAMYKNQETENTSTNHVNASYDQEDLETLIKQNKVLDERLKAAIKKETIQTYFQPQIDMRDNKIAGFEALLCWQDEELGYISPNLFIQIAEKSGYMQSLDKYVIHHVFKSAGELLNKDNLKHISLNISSATILNEELFFYILEELHRYSLSSTSFIIELTETERIKNLDVFKTITKKYIKEGFKFSLDDYGMGYNSLSLLNTQRFYEIKIDKSFIDAINDPKEISIIKSIMQLAKTMDLNVVAEGVEREDQRDKLLRLGCHFAQGYLFSKAVTLEEAKEYLKINSSRSI